MKKYRIIQDFLWLKVGQTIETVEDRVSFKKNIDDEEIIILLISKHPEIFEEIIEKEVNGGGAGGESGGGVMSIEELFNKLFPNGVHINGHPLKRSDNIMAGGFAGQKNGCNCKGSAGGSGSGGGLPIRFESFEEWAIETGHKLVGAQGVDGSKYFSCAAGHVVRNGESCKNCNK